MHDLIRKVTIGGLLHDVGKILHRGANVDGRSHSISGWEWIKEYTQEQDLLDSIRYHHHQDMDEAQLEKDSPAYIVYLADNISAGADRRDIEGEKREGFARGRPLESVYNLLNNAEGKAVHKAAAISTKINYPHADEGLDLAYDYNKIIAGMRDGIYAIDFTKEYINSLLELTEAYLSYIPSSTYLGEVSDISLFDHSKITAGIAACIAHYLNAHNRSDYRRELFEKRREFYGEKAFCMFSCEISGVQQFIYTITSKGALKGLRARSFYLELMMENLADEILENCGLYRTNLIYTGGAHGYILLPNTDTAKNQAAEAVKKTNQMLLQKFGARLFAAHALQECSAAEIMNNTGDSEAYSNIFRSLSVQISASKLRRYDASEIRLLNQGYTDKEGRECRICGISSELVEKEDWDGEDKMTLCSTCASLSDISGLLIKPDTVFMVARENLGGPSLPLASGKGEPLYFHARKAEEARRLLQEHPEHILRLYSKNTFRTGLTLATKLWLGDYAATNKDGEIKTFKELAKSSRGIERIGVLRADVDNMGLAFIKGFLRENAEGEARYRYLTLSRTSTLSRSLSIFFKYYLNDLLANGSHSMLSEEGQRNIVVVYSGGDDLFLVGAWNEVLAAALDIRQAFADYTGGILSISAGMAMFEPGYPISRMAAETGLLEEKAKGNQHEGREKDSISLLGLELTPVTKDGETRMELKDNHTYSWDVFANKVLGEKYRQIEELFSLGTDFGNSFLYGIVNLLRNDEPGRINIARLAYLLARHEPRKEKDKVVYHNFSRNVYSWAGDAEDRQQLLTALIIYTYANREKGDE